MTFEYVVKNIAIKGIITPLIYLGFAFALLYFFWGLVGLIRDTGNKIDHTKNRDRIIWGIVGLAAMVSVWGLVGIVLNTVFPGGVPSAANPPIITAPR